MKVIGAVSVPEKLESEADYEEDIDLEDVYSDDDEDLDVDGEDDITEVEEEDDEEEDEEEDDGFQAEQDIESDADAEDETSEEAEHEDDEDDSIGSKKTVNKLSKAEIRLIAQKKQIKQLQREKQELEAKMQEKAIANEKEAIKQKFISEDYDEDVAEKMANDELRIRQLEERQAMLDFRDENEELFARYPQAKKEATRIMKSMQATGMTAEQICRGMYGTVKTANEAERRALDAVKGNIQSKQAKKSPSSIGTNTVDLTSQQLKHKAFIERNFLDGDKMSTQEYMKFLQRNKSTVTKNERRY